MDEFEKFLDIPLEKANGHLREILILLADEFHHTNWRPCLDNKTTLGDWLESYKASTSY